MYSENASASASHQTAALSKLCTYLLVSGHGFYNILILPHSDFTVKFFFDKFVFYLFEIYVYSLLFTTLLYAGRIIFPPVITSSILWAHQPTILAIAKRGV